MEISRFIEDILQEIYKREVHAPENHIEPAVSTQTAHERPENTVTHSSGTDDSVGVADVVDSSVKLLLADIDFSCPFDPSADISNDDSEQRTTNNNCINEDKTSLLRSNSLSHSTEADNDSKELLRLNEGNLNGGVSCDHESAADAIGAAGVMTDTCVSSRDQHAVHAAASDVHTSLKSTSDCTSNLVSSDIVDSVFNSERESSTQSIQGIKLCVF